MSRRPRTALTGSTTKCSTARTKPTPTASILMPIMVNIGNVQYVIVAMVGGALALSGVDTTITLGVIASFLQLSKSFSNPINQISQQFNSIIMALARRGADLRPDGRGAGGGPRHCDAGKRVL